MFRIRDEQKNNIRSEQFQTRLNACEQVLRESSIKRSVKSIYQIYSLIVEEENDRESFEQKRERFENAISELEKYVNSHRSDVDLKLLSNKELNQHFYYACINSKHLTVDRVKEYFDLGADLNFIDDEYDKFTLTPFHHVANTDNVDILREFFKRGANPNVDFGDNYKTSVFVRYHSSNLEKIKLFVENGARIDSVDTRGESVLHEVSHSANAFECVKYLVTKGADVNLRDKDGRNPLFNAIICNGHRILEYLLHEGADMNCADNAGITPLLLAVSLDRTESARILLESGADKTIRNGQNKTAYELALEKGYLESAKLLEPNKYESDYKNRPDFKEIIESKKKIVDKLKRGLSYRTSNREYHAELKCENGVYKYELYDNFSPDVEDVRTFETDDEALKFLYNQVNWELNRGKTEAQLYKNLIERIF